MPKSESFVTVAITGKPAAQYSKNLVEYAARHSALSSYGTTPKSKHDTILEHYGVVATDAPGLSARSSLKRLFICLIKGRAEPVKLDSTIKVCPEVGK